MPKMMGRGRRNILQLVSVHRLQGGLAYEIKVKYVEMGGRFV